MDVIIWSKDNCPNCEKAKALLKLKGVEYEERKIGHGWSREDLLEVVPHARTVPQIFFDQTCIGGYTELEERIG